MVMKDVSNLESHRKSVGTSPNNRRKTSVSFSSDNVVIDKSLDSRNFHEKLKQIEQEKGETEEVLSSLRGKLEEYRRLSHLKRQRVSDRRGSELLEALRDVPGVQNGAVVDDDLLKELLEKESQALEGKIKTLESQKGEMEETIMELFRQYEGKNSVLQQEKKRLEDDKDTTYAEMKSLLIEQHEESERLRSKVTRLESKRRKVAFAAKSLVAFLSLAVVGVAVWLNFFVDDISSVVGSLNYLCAPARPGTQISESSGAVASPWWAPPYTKELIFPLVCQDRPRIRMEIKRGILSITHQPSGALVAKKMGRTAYIEAEKLHISDTGGGHKEMQAPWAVPEGRRE